MKSVANSSQFMFRMDDCTSLEDECIRELDIASIADRLDAII